MSFDLGSAAGAIGGSNSGSVNMSDGKNDTGETIGSIVGAIVGAYFGGPAGAMLGSQLGAQLGGMIEGWVSSGADEETVSQNVDDYVNQNRSELEAAGIDADKFGEALKASSAVIQSGETDGATQAADQYLQSQGATPEMVESANNVANEVNSDVNDQTLPAPSKGN